eukprot:gene17573-20238_t
MVGFKNIVSNFRVLQSFPLALTLKRVFYVVGGVFAVTYLLFQKKLLPLPIAKVASKILFFPTFPITALLRLGNYWTQVDDTLILGCAPMGFLGHPEQIKKLGVTGVVNMCYEYQGPVSQYKKLGIKQLYLPTVDHTEPSPDKLRAAVEFIKDHQKRGEKVYVHCKAGHGRAASVALSWLMSEYKDRSAKDLNVLLRQKRFVRTKLYQQKNIIEFKEWVDSQR